MNPLNEKELAWFARHYQTTTEYQRRKGRTVCLSFEEYLSLWFQSPYKTACIRKEINTGKVTSFQKSERAYCLSWISFKHKQSNIVCPETMGIYKRNESKVRSSLRQGDQHTEESKAKIAEARKGTKHRETTKASISTSMKGKPKSEEHRAAIAAAAKARWAAKRGEAL